MPCPFFAHRFPQEGTFEEARFRLRCRSDREFSRARSGLQDDDQLIIFGVYYRCSQGQEARADEIHNQVVAPVIQKHIDAGHLSGQGWLAHRQGGP